MALVFFWFGFVLVGCGLVVVVVLVVVGVFFSLWSGIPGLNYRPGPAARELLRGRGRPFFLWGAVGGGGYFEDTGVPFWGTPQHVFPQNQKEHHYLGGGGTLKNDRPVGPTGSVK